MNYKPLLKRMRAHVADGMVFYQKLRHYHWHVRGQGFFELHARFETLYLRWAEIVDDLAEHIVMRGGAAPTSLQAMTELATLREDASIPPAGTMVTNLADDLERLLASIERTIAVASEHGDGIAVNLLEAVRDGQAKTLWMLRAWADDTSRKILETPPVS